ncbi:MAG: hypothetical protein HY392_02075 [Candidatus Diapherotrites archaeon]|nr:hypothetical protein [Candidatus Diapherotrites archaeon]
MVFTAAMTWIRELEGFIVKPCASRTGYDFLPRRQAEIDLGKASHKLRERGFTIDFETPVFFSAKINGKSVSVFKSGKISVKDEKNEEEAAMAAQTVIKEIFA